MHLPSFFFFAFHSQLHFNARLLPSLSSTLLSVFPSPYINPSEGEVSQAPDKKNIPPNEDLWNGNLANPSEWVCLRVRGWRRFHLGHSLTLSIHSLLFTTAPHRYNTTLWKALNTLTYFGGLFAENTHYFSFQNCIKISQISRTLSTESLVHNVQ